MCMFCVLGSISLLSSSPGEAQYLQGCELYREASYAQAIRAFEVAGGADPMLAPWAAVRMGMCLAGQRKNEDAKAVFQQVIAGPDGPWQAMARGHLSKLLAEGEDDAGIVTHLAGFESIAPIPWWMDDYVWQYSESALRQPGDHRNGYAYFRDKAENTWYIQPRLDASRFLLRSAAPPDQADALLGMLRSSAYKDIQDALPKLSVGLTNENNDRILLNGLVALLTDTDPANDAGALAVVRKHASNPAARFLLAYASRTLATRKDFAGAERLCAALIELDPESRDAGETVWWLGGALERAERRADAERIYEWLPSKCKNHFRADDALNRLGELYLEDCNAKKGMEYFLRLGREYPESRFRPGAYYTCAMRPEVQGDKNVKQMYLKAAADDGIGYYWAHRALARLHEMESPSEPPAINLRVDGVKPVLLPAAGYMEPLPPLPPIITESPEYQRLAFFARHGLEESEWEVLPLLQALEKVEFKEPYYRAFAEAGLAHTALQFATHEGWGVDDKGKRSLARLRLEYPLAYWPEVQELAKATGLDPYLMLAVAKQESTFRPNLTSHAGASGVMQLMPGTAKWLADVDPNIEKSHVANLESPVNSLRLGAFYLLRMFERSNGNLVDTLASYNGGPGNRDKWRKRFPNYDLDEFVHAIPFEETKNYVQKVLGNYAAYRSLYEPAP